MDKTQIDNNNNKNYSGNHTSAKEQKELCRVFLKGESYDFPEGTTFREIADKVQDQYEDDILLAYFDGYLIELGKELPYSGTLQFLTAVQKPGRSTYRRSVTFLMLTAIYQLFPEYSVVVQHSIGQGYYCEVRDAQGDLFIPDCVFVETVEERMHQLQEMDLPLKKTSIHTRDALKLFARFHMTDKYRLFRYRRSSRMNIYELEGFVEYFYGSMVPSTGYLKCFSLQTYQHGFMLMFPDKDTRKAEAFHASDKLFQILEDASDWGSSLGVDTVGALDDTIASGKVQDLILIQEAYMEQKIGAIAQQIAQRQGCKFVMIAGPSSSGKTTFSHRLSIQLRAQGLTPHPVSLDDFYVNREETPKDEFGEYDFECLEAIDVELFNEIMGDLLVGKERNMPTFNFKTGCREYRGNSLKLGENDILVIEGIHGLNENLSYQLPENSKFKIYISALTQLNIDNHNNLSTADGRLIRRMVRDARTRNTTARETLARWDSVRRGEEKNIFPYQEEADVMFNSALIYELSVLKLYAEPLLFGVPSDCPEYLEAKRLLKFLDYVLPVPSETINHNSILREFIGGSCFNV